MVKLRQSYGKVFGKAVAKLWQRDTEVMVKLCLAPYCSEASNRCTGASTDAQNIDIYILYIYDDGDGWIGLILDGGYVCLMFFWMGWGGSMVFG